MFPWYQELQVLHFIELPTCSHQVQVCFPSRINFWIILPMPLYSSFWKVMKSFQVRQFLWNQYSMWRALEETKGPTRLDSSYLSQRAHSCIPSIFHCSSSLNSSSFCSSSTSSIISSSTSLWGLLHGFPVNLSLYSSYHLCCYCYIWVWFLIELNIESVPLSE